MVKQNKLWISRDNTGTGLYNLWAGRKPVLLDTGYYGTLLRDGNGAMNETIHLVTIHYTRYPFAEVLLKGECADVEVDFTVIKQPELLTESKGDKDNGVVQQGSIDGQCG